MNPRHSALRATRSLAPLEPTNEDVWEALEAEARLLRPYASTNGLSRLRDRLAAIRLAQHRLRGLPLEEVR